MLNAKEILEKHIGDLRDQIQELEKRIGRLDVELAPVWIAEDHLKARIAGTHRKDASGRIVFRLEGAEARKHLFEGLLGIAIKHGSVRAKRSELAQRSRGYQREATKIEQELSRLTRKDTKQGKQGKLF